MRIRESLSRRFKNGFKAEVENRTDKSVLVVYDWRKTHSGIEIILYAFES